MVGGLNTGIDIGILAILMKLSGITGGFYYAAFKTFSSVVAITNSYFLNKKWTFQDKSKGSVGEAGQFFFVSGIGLLINVIVASLVVNFISPLNPLISFVSSILKIAGLNLNGAEIWGMISAGFGSLAGLGWNFTGYKFFIFRK